MAEEFKCPGDCTQCEYLERGQTNPAECASIWGFMHVKNMHHDMRKMHAEIKEMVSGIAQLVGGAGLSNIPGVRCVGTELAPPVEETEVVPTEVVQ